MDLLSPFFIESNMQQNEQKEFGCYICGYRLYDWIISWQLRKKLFESEVSPLLNKKFHLKKRWKDSALCLHYDLKKKTLLILASNFKDMFIGVNNLHFSS